MSWYLQFDPNALGIEATWGFTSTHLLSILSKFPGSENMQKIGSFKYTPEN